MIETLKENKEFISILFVGVITLGGVVSTTRRVKSLESCNRKLSQDKEQLSKRLDKLDKVSSGFLESLDKLSNLTTSNCKILEESNDKLIESTHLAQSLDYASVELLKVIKQYESMIEDFDKVKTEEDS